MLKHKVIYLHFFSFPVISFLFISLSFFCQSFFKAVKSLADHNLKFYFIDGKYLKLKFNIMFFS